VDREELARVKRAMRGNPTAFGELIQREQEYLYRMAYLYTHQEADALDVVQESILKAYKSVKTLRDPEYFRTWLTRIVINTAQDLLRHRREEFPLEEGAQLPAQEALTPEERMDLYQALEQLPEKYRDVVKLKYLDGCTIREISDATGMPQGTVSVYLRRAVSRLRDQLKEEPLCEKP
jgi:RNA polymerase sigma-70 factor (ECF subfamily)